jgi:hypothetical protein
MHWDKWVNLEHLVVVLVVMEDLLQLEQEIRHQHLHHKEIQEDMLAPMPGAAGVLELLEVEQGRARVLVRLVVSV